MEQATKKEFRQMRSDIMFLTDLLLEINNDLHIVKKSYINKLRKIKKSSRLVSREEAEKRLGVEF